ALPRPAVTAAGACFPFPFGRPALRRDAVSRGGGAAGGVVRPPSPHHEPRLCLPATLRPSSAAFPSRAVFFPQGPGRQPSVARQARRVSGAALGPPPPGFPNRKPEKMIDIKAWAEYVVEWAAKDPYGFLTTVILALTPLFIISAALSWKLAKMIEAREREQKKKQKRQENIAKAKRTKKD
uniref:Small integral membrane protein 15 n=2 Tax=Amazona TaxID=12929 RepID=A0A8B9FTB1_9PSIT